MRGSIFFYLESDVRLGFVVYVYAPHGNLETVIRRLFHHAAHLNRILWPLQAGSGQGLPVSKR